jgi:hypothetical protein
MKDGMDHWHDPRSDLTIAELMERARYFRAMAMTAPRAESRREFGLLAARYARRVAIASGDTGDASVNRLAREAGG